MNQHVLTMHAITTNTLHLSLNSLFIIVHFIYFHQIAMKIIMILIIRTNFLLQLILQYKLHHLLLITKAVFIRFPFFKLNLTFQIQPKFHNLKFFHNQNNFNLDRNEE